MDPKSYRQALAFINGWIQADPTSERAMLHLLAKIAGKQYVSVMIDFQSYVVESQNFPRPMGVTL